MIAEGFRFGFKQLDWDQLCHAVRALDEYPVREFCHEVANMFRLLGRE